MSHPGTSTDVPEPSSQSLSAHRAESTAEPLQIDTSHTIRASRIANPDPAGNNTPNAPETTLGKAQRASGMPSVPRGRLLAASGILVLLLGVFGAGGVAGWLVHDRIQADRAQSMPPVIEIPMISDSISKVVPDVRGLSLNEATQALADLNITPDTITTEEVPWAGTPGLVVAQDPVVGSAFDGSLHLSISAAATVPDLLGKTQSDAMDSLLALGVQPQIERRFDPSAKTGTVIALSQEPGAPLADDLTITVADVGSSILLSTLKNANSSGDCSNTKGSVNGTSYDNALACASSRNSEERVTAWILGRHGSRFTAVLGVLDTDPADSRVSVRVLADGVEVQKAEATYGAPTTIDVDVSSTLRLEVAVASPTNTRAVLANALIKGTTDQIDLLEASNR